MIFFSKDVYLDNKLSYVKKVFHEQKQYRFWARNVVCEINQQNHKQQHEQH